jgi:hypothetical protein
MIFVGVDWAEAHHDVFVEKGLPWVWLTLFVPGVAGWEGCRDAQEVPTRVQAGCR